MFFDVRQPPFSALITVISRQISRHPSQRTYRGSLWATAARGKSRRISSFTTEAGERDVESAVILRAGKAAPRLLFCQTGEEGLHRDHVSSFWRRCKHLVSYRHNSTITIESMVWTCNKKKKNMLEGGNKKKKHEMVRWESERMMHAHGAGLIRLAHAYNFRVISPLIG